MESKEQIKLSRGQQAILLVLSIGVGSVFLALCYRAVLWILGVS